MKQIIILITAIIIGATTCNAQGWQGFARRAKKAVTTTTKVFNKCRTPIITGTALCSTSLSNQRDRQLRTPNARVPHPNLSKKGVLLTPKAVTKMKSFNTIHPCTAALLLDSMNLSMHHVMVSPKDTAQVQVQDSITFK